MFLCLFFFYKEACWVVLVVVVRAGVEVWFVDYACSRKHLPPIWHHLCSIVLCIFSRMVLTIESVLPIDKRPPPTRRKICQKRCTLDQCWKASFDGVIFCCCFSLLFVLPYFVLFSVCSSLFLYRSFNFCIYFLYSFTFIWIYVTDFVLSLDSYELYC